MDHDLVMGDHKTKEMPCNLLGMTGQHVSQIGRDIFLDSNTPAKTMPNISTILNIAIWRSVPSNRRFGS